MIARQHRGSNQDFKKSEDTPLTAALADTLLFFCPQQPVKLAHHEILTPLHHKGDPRQNVTAVNCMCLMLGLVAATASVYLRPAFILDISNLP